MLGVRSGCGAVAGRVVPELVAECVMCLILKSLNFCPKRELVRGRATREEDEGLLEVDVDAGPAGRELATVTIVLNCSWDDVPGRGLSNLAGSLPLPGEAP